MTDFAREKLGFRRNDEQLEKDTLVSLHGWGLTENLTREISFPNEGRGKVASYFQIPGHHELEAARCSKEARGISRICRLPRASYERDQSPTGAAVVARISTLPPPIPPAEPAAYLALSLIHISEPTRPY